MSPPMIANYACEGGNFKICIIAEVTAFFGNEHFCITAFTAFRKLLDWFCSIAKNTTPRKNANTLYFALISALNRCMFSFWFRFMSRTHAGTSISFMYMYAWSSGRLVMKSRVRPYMACGDHVSGDVISSTFSQIGLEGTHFSSLGRIPDLYWRKIGASCVYTGLSYAVTLCEVCAFLRLSMIILSS